MEETIGCQCQSIISINSRQQVVLKENRIEVLLKENMFQCLYNLTDLSRLITFVILVLLHTVSKIGIYGLLYILTYSP